MGMAMIETYPVPKVRKIWGNMWRVTWADITNRVYYRDFVNWGRAMHYATTGKEPYGY